MPWTKASATSHTKKADTPKRKRQWSKVANAVLEETHDEGRAVRIANAAVKKAKLKSTKSAKNGDMNVSSSASRSPSRRKSRSSSASARSRKSTASRSKTRSRSRTSSASPMKSRTKPRAKARKSTGRSKMSSSRK